MTLCRVAAFTDEQKGNYLAEGASQVGLSRLLKRPELSQVSKYLRHKGSRKVSHRGVDEPSSLADIFFGLSCFPASP